MQPHERIIVALDCSLNSALHLSPQLQDHVGYFKIGLQFMYETMADIIHWDRLGALGVFDNFRAFVQAKQTNLILDTKLHDIPNAIAGATRAVARICPAWFMVHASSGLEAIRAAVTNKGKSKIFGVTVLTSLKESDCLKIFGSESKVKVFEFAETLLDAGVDGIICSPIEGRMLRSFPRFNAMTIACPNIRPKWAPSKDDQNKDRQMMPADAIREGIDMLVIGRPITNPPQEIGLPAEAAQRIADEIASAL